MKNMKPEDVAVFKEEHYDGELFMLLKEKTYKRDLDYFKRKLSRHGQLKLEIIFRSDHADTCTDSVETDGQNDINIEPKTTCDEYTAFGLGCAIDASCECVPSSSSKKIRSVLPDLSNVDENVIDSGKESLSEERESRVTREAGMNVSLSDIVASHLKLEGGVKYGRHAGNKVAVTGEKIVTRTVCFKKPDFSEDNQPDLPEDSDFEHRFCEWLAENIRDIEKSPGNSTIVKVQGYIASNPGKFDSVVEKAYCFLLIVKFTHYVDAIDLGAARYSTNTTSATGSTGGASIAAGTQAVGEANVSLSCSKEDSTKKAEVKEIGKFDDVDRGRNEGVVRYQLLPVSTLCTQKKVGEVLQKAIDLYREKASGPFYMKGGKRYDRYLQVVANKKSDVLKATETKEDASVFFLKKSGKESGKFTIEYRDEHNSSSYVTTGSWSKFSGKGKGPLQMSPSKFAQFSIRHSRNDKEEHDFDYWEKNPCFVEISTGKLQHKSYLGLCTDTNDTRQVGEMKTKKKSNISQLFKIERKRKLNDPELEASPCQKRRKL